MSRDVQRMLAFGVAFIALCLVLVVLGERLLGFAAGPEAELVTQLKKAERGVEIELPGGGTLIGTNLNFQRLSVVVDEGQQRAVATGTLDFTGHLMRPDSEWATKVSSLGLERVEFVKKGGGWGPSAGFAPRLVQIVRALEARRRDIESGSFTPESDEAKRVAALTKRSYRSDAWFIRSERAEVSVAEDFRLVGDAPERPVDEKATKRLTLHEDEKGSFFFSNGLL